MLYLIGESYELDTEECSVRSIESGLLTVLGSNEVRLLVYFIDNQGKILPRQTLLDEIWSKRGVVVEDSSLMQAISAIRKALEDKNGKLIKTERGVGYKLVADARLLPEKGEVNEECSESSLKKVNSRTIYLMAFSIPLLMSSLFFYFNNEMFISSEKLLIREYSYCTVELPETGEKIRYADVAMFGDDSKRLLYSKVGDSIAFPITFKGYDCE